MITASRHSHQQALSADNSAITQLLTLLVDNIKGIVGGQAYVTYRQMEGLIAIYNTLPIEIPLPQMREWPVSPDFAMLFLTEILLRKPGIILETGSGVSTLIAGYAAKKNGHGKVIALEHHPVFYKKTSDLVRAHKLDNYVDLYFTPLIEHRSGDERHVWYDVSKVNFSGKIGVFIVDGPPGETSAHTRYPVLPLFAGKAAENAVLFLDDAAREEEVKITQRWLREFPLFKIQEGYFCEKGVVVLEKHEHSGNNPS